MGVGEADSDGVASLVGETETFGVAETDFGDVDVSVVEESVFPPRALRTPIKTTKVITRRSVFLPFVSPGFPVATSHNSLIFESPEGFAEFMTL